MVDNKEYSSIQVHGDRVCVEIQPSSGMFQVDNPLGIVLSVGYGELSKNIKVGDIVALEKNFMDRSLKVGGKSFTIVRSSDVVATLKK